MMTLERVRELVGEKHWEAFQQEMDMSVVLESEEEELSFLDAWKYQRDTAACASDIYEQLAKYAVDYILGCGVSVEDYLDFTDMIYRPDFAEQMLVAIDKEGSSRKQ